MSWNQSSDDAFYPFQTSLKRFFQAILPGNCYFTEHQFTPFPNSSSNFNAIYLKLQFWQQTKYLFFIRECIYSFLFVYFNFFLFFFSFCTTNLTNSLTFNNITRSCIYPPLGLKGISKNLNR